MEKREAGMNGYQHFAVILLLVVVVPLVVLGSESRSSGLLFHASMRLEPFGWTPLIVVAIVLVALWRGDRIASRSGQGHARKSIWVVAAILGAAGIVGLIGYVMSGPVAYALHRLEGPVEGHRLERVSFADTGVKHCWNRVFLEGNSVFFRREFCNVPADVLPAATPGSVLRLEGLVSSWGVQVRRLAIEKKGAN